MGIQIGQPISWTQIATDVLASYPEYSSPDNLMGMPITTSQAQALAIAHLCPPNLDVRPMSLGALDVNTIPLPGVTFDGLENVSLLSPPPTSPKPPFMAGNFFAAFQSARYDAPNPPAFESVLAPQQAYNEVIEDIALHITSKPGSILIAQMFTAYVTPGSGGPGHGYPNYFGSGWIVVARCAFRDP